MPDRARAHALAAAAAPHGVEHLLVGSGPNLRWLTGFTGSNGLAILDVAQGSGAGGIFLTDFRYMEQAAVQLAGGWDLRRSAQELFGPGLADLFGDERADEIGRAS
ncbi:MAG: hypothetical protein F2796_05455, partial [Actinobacteria bacterium]|nr:hypothetical protein [Actinomycetota bacterium]